MVFYGLARPRHVRDYARNVCDVLGRGVNNNAMQMLIETAAQETHCGQYRDPSPDGAGRGLCQIDLIAHNDVKDRTREHNVGRVFETFNLDIRVLDHRELDHSPLASMVMCRLFYILVPDLFPTTLEGRAAYWKRHYNKSGKGTEAEFIENAKRFGA